MSGAGFELQKAIYALLTADATLKTLAGDPVRVFDAPPLRGPFPFIVIGDWRETPVAGADNLAEHDFRIAVHSRYDGKREAREIVTAILSALEDAAPAIAGFTVVSCRARFADIIQRSDVEAFQGVIRFRAVTEEG